MRASRHGLLGCACLLVCGACTKPTTARMELQAPTQLDADPVPRGHRIERQAVLQAACDHASQALFEAGATSFDAYEQTLTNLDDEAANRSRKQLRDAERLWTRALQLGACPTDLRCLQGDQVIARSEHHPSEPGAVIREPPPPGGIERFSIRLANGLCLHASDDGTIVQQYCEPVAAQRWLTTGADDHAVVMRNAKTRTCIEATDTGALVLGACSSSDEQRFCVENKVDDYVSLQRARPIAAEGAEPPPPAEPPKNDKKAPKPTCKGQSWCVGVPADAAPGTAVQVTACDGRAEQRLLVSRSPVVETLVLECPGELTIPGGCPSRALGDDEPMFLPIAAGNRGRFDWKCDGRPAQSSCPGKARYVELLREGGQVQARCIE